MTEAAEPPSAIVPRELTLSEDVVFPVIMAREGRVVGTTAAARILFGKRATVGARVVDLFDEACREKARVALAGPVPSTCELAVVGDGGVRAFVRFLVSQAADGTRLLVAAPRPESAVETEEVLLTVNAELVRMGRDLARKAAALEAARADLAELGRLRDEFMAVLAHDLKSGLGAVALQAELLARLGPQGLGDAGVEKIALALRRAALRMSLLIRNVLDAAFATERGPSFERRPVDLKKVALEAIDTLQPIALEAGVHVELAASSRGARASGDRVRLYQVVLNLLGNALRHAPRGTTVRVRVEDNDRVVRCTVADDGPGVAPELRELIFERFRAAGEHKGAAGLGLYIVRTLVEAHGGRAWTQDGADGGAEFVFEVPVASPA